jgi:hypothetical protein
MRLGVEAPRISVLLREFREIGRGVAWHDLIGGVIFQDDDEDVRIARHFKLPWRTVWFRQAGERPLRNRNNDGSGNPQCAPRSASGHPGFPIVRGCVLPKSIMIRQ